MSVNLYDVAYDLEKALRHSEEYSALRNLYDEVNGDESSKRMFENFRDIQVNLQQKQMTGQEITQEEVEQAQKRLHLCKEDDKISQLMEAEQRVSVLIGELNKIIMKPLEELYGNTEEN